MYNATRIILYTLIFILLEIFYASLMIEFWHTIFIVPIIHAGIANYFWWDITVLSKREIKDE